MNNLAELAALLKKIPDRDFLMERFALTELPGLAYLVGSEEPSLAGVESVDVTAEGSRINPEHGPGHRSFRGFIEHEGTSHFLDEIHSIGDGGIMVQTLNFPAISAELSGRHSTSSSPEQIAGYMFVIGRRSSNFVFVGLKCDDRRLVESLHTYAVVAFIDAIAQDPTSTAHQALATLCDDLKIDWSYSLDTFCRED